MAIDKKSAAQILFESNWEQKRIAEMFGISEQTLSSWATKGEWAKKRAEKNLSEQVAVTDVWELINYQTMVLKSRKNSWLAKFKEEKLDELPLLDKGDIDALQKLFTTVKGKQLEWSEIVKLIADLTTFLNERDTDLTKKVLNHFDDFINYKRKKL